MDGLSMAQTSGQKEAGEVFKKTMDRMADDGANPDALIVVTMERAGDGRIRHQFGGFGAVTDIIWALERLKADIMEGKADGE